MRHRAEIGGGGGMAPWIFSKRWPPRLTLVFLVACFYAGVVLINDELLFFWAAETSYRYWFYPPAGVRLILIMLLGWRGLVGYFIAVLAIHHSELMPEVEGFEAAFAIAAVRALSLWGGLVAFGKLTGVKHPWDRLTWHHVPFLAVWVNLVSDSAVHLVRHFLGVEGADWIVRNVALNVLGDTLGTIVVLAIVIRLRRDYRQYSKNGQSLD